MNRYDRYVGIVLFFFGLMIFINSFRYPLGSLRSPGAGFFPLFASLVLMGLAIAIAGSTFPRNVGAAMTGPSLFPTREAPRRIFITLLSLVAFRYLLPLMGLALTTFLFILFLSRYLAHYGLKISLPLALAAAFLSYFVFEYLLKIPFPRGLLGF